MFKERKLWKISRTVETRPLYIYSAPGVFDPPPSICKIILRNSSSSLTRHSSPRTQHTLKRYRTRYISSRTWCTYSTTHTIHARCYCTCIFIPLDVLIRIVQHASILPDAHHMRGVKTRLVRFICYVL